MPIELLRTQANTEAVQTHLREIQNYNQYILGEFNKCRPLNGSSLLDVGASIHGFALLAAHDIKVAAYTGIDLDVVKKWNTTEQRFNSDTKATHRLLQMNAEELQFPNDSFDYIMSISTFEHFLNPEKCLAEMARVLKPGGALFVSFEPIWSSARGHHLHHFGEISDLVPPWAHLFLNKQQYAKMLTQIKWPKSCPVSQEQALHWIYDGIGINRINLVQLKSVFEQSLLEIEWCVALGSEDDESLRHIAEYVSNITNFTPDELLTRGLSLLLKRPL